MPAPAKKELFLLGQQLRQLIAPDDPELIRALVCRTEKLRTFGSESFDPEKFWEVRTRDEIVNLAVNPAPDSNKRFGLVCDAGLGKSWNMTYMFDKLCDRKYRPMVPFLLKLEDGKERQHILDDLEKPDALLDWFTNRVAHAAGRPDDRERIKQELRRKREQHQVCLLLDGLDHALTVKEFPSRLREFLDSSLWKPCPIWLSGRPYAFKDAWANVFEKSLHEWQFCRVDRFRDTEIRQYMIETGTGDWYDILPARELLAVPRLLALICRNIRTAIKAQPPKPAGEVVRGLNLTTPARVYAKAYFEKGKDGDRDSQGLIAQGLNEPPACWMNFPDGYPVHYGNLKDRIQRVGVLLGVTAFHMFKMNNDVEPPEPNTGGAELDAIQGKLIERLIEAGQGGRAEYDRDFRPRLTHMNIHHLEFLLLAESEEYVRFPDRTVQAFFAAYFAMRFGTPDEIRVMKGKWIIDKEKGESLTTFDEFWQFAAEMPPEWIGLKEAGPSSPWFQTFAPSYEPPAKIPGEHDWIQWHRRMVHHTFPTMERQFAGTIKQWRKPFLDWQAANDEEYQAWKNGFKAIPAGDCWVGAVPVSDFPRPGIRTPVEGFHLHQFPVTNELFERLFGSVHKPRWTEEKPHPLVEQAAAGADDHCPVVNVTWFDAWCVAAMCFVDGRRCSLPTGLQWEHALRAGTAFQFSYGNDEEELQKYAWFRENSGNMTHPVGLKPEPPHPNGLFDMEGNVWEWCEDWSESEQKYRVLRGGSWFSNAGYWGAAGRLRYEPKYSLPYIGFRLVLPGPV